MKIKDAIEREREIEEMEKDYCLECGVEVFDGGSWGYCVPCGNAAWGKLVGGKSKTLNRTPNHAVGEVYKPAALNTHDPHDQYQWADENLPWWAWPLRLLGGLAFIAGIYSLVFLGVLL